MIRFLIAGIVVLMAGNASAFERLTSDQIRPYAKKMCGVDQRLRWSLFILQWYDHG